MSQKKFFFKEYSVYGVYGVCVSSEWHFIPNFASKSKALETIGQFFLGGFAASKQRLALRVDSCNISYICYT